MALFECIYGFLGVMRALLGVCRALLIVYRAHLGSPDRIQGYFGCIHGFFERI